MKRKTPELVRSTTRRCRLRWVLASTPRRVSRTLMPPPVQVPPAPWVGENPCPRAASPGGAVAAQGVGADRAHRGWSPSGVEEPAVVGVGGRGENVQGQAVAVGEQVVLGARVRVVGGVRAGQLAPLFGFVPTPSRCWPLSSRGSAPRRAPRARPGGASLKPRPPVTRAEATRRCVRTRAPEPVAGQRHRGMQHEQDALHSGPVIDPRRLPGPRGGVRGGMSGAISSHSRSSTAASSWPYRNGQPAGRGRSTTDQVLKTDVR